jgi:hypothetical protein
VTASDAKLLKVVADHLEREAHGALATGIISALARQRSSMVSSWICWISAIRLIRLGIVTLLLLDLLLLLGRLTLARVA